jgi:hypothetical protein
MGIHEEQHAEVYVIGFKAAKQFFKIEAAGVKFPAHTVLLAQIDGPYPVSNNMPLKSAAKIAFLPVSGQKVQLFQYGFLKIQNVVPEIKNNP